MAQTTLSMSRELAALVVDRDQLLFDALKAIFTERCRAALYTSGGVLPADDQLKLLAAEVAATYPSRHPGQLAAKLLAGD